MRSPLPTLAALALDLALTGCASRTSTPKAAEVLATAEKREQFQVWMNQIEAWEIVGKSLKRDE